MSIDSGPDMRVLALREAHIARTADVLAQAFAMDAAYSYLFPEPQTRIPRLSDFFRRSLRTHLPFACTFVALDGVDRLVATVTLRPPLGFQISLWTILRRGLLPFAIAHGLAAVRRLLWLKETYDALEADAAASAPHSYVHMMAVAPDQQGRGLGNRLLAHVLAERAAPQTVLTTNLERNVVFYRRHAFEVSSERWLQPPGSHPYTVWSMRRTCSDEDAGT